MWMLIVLVALRGKEVVVRGHCKFSVALLSAFIVCSERKWICFNVRDNDSQKLVKNDNKVPRVSDCYPRESKQESKQFLERSLKVVIESSKEKVL